MGHLRQSRRPTRLQGGYSLVELVTVITLTGIVALVPAQVMLQSLTVYAATAPRLDASYQTQLATERLKRDFRELDDRGSLTVMEPDALTFTDTSGQTLVYALSDDGELTRNGDLLARDVSDLTLRYLDETGAETDLASRMRMLEVDLTVTIAGQSYRQCEAAYPRHARDAESPLDLEASLETLAVHDSFFEIDMVSISASDLVIDTVAVSADEDLPGLKQLRIDDNLIYSSFFWGTSLPTGALTPNRGTVEDRTLPALTSPTLCVKFQYSPDADPVTVTVKLVFTDGSTATLTPVMGW